MPVCISLVTTQCVATGCVATHYGSIKRPMVWSRVVSDLHRAFGIAEMHANPDEPVHPDIDTIKFVANVEIANKAPLFAQWAVREF